MKNIYKLRIWMKSYFVQDPFVFTKSVVVNDFQLFDQSGFSGFGWSEEKNFNLEIPGLRIIRMIYLGIVFTVEAEKEFWITSVAHSQTELASSHKQLALVPLCLSRFRQSYLGIFHRFALKQLKTCLCSKDKNSHSS